MISSIPGKAVDGALRLARFPADRLLKVAPETAATATVGLAIDRAEAAVRGAAGSVLRDHGLRDDAELRRAAADERKHAMRLRTKAHERIETAETRTDEKQAESVARRKQADERAEQKRAQAADQRERLKKQAATTATKRKQAAHAKAEKAEENAEKRGRIDRLEQLEKKSDALEVKEAAIRAADEAQRIEEATTVAKEKRRANSADGK
jgi:colicin import membrane protein